MPIPLPDLDDLSYSDLVAEALARLPTLAPEWTNHNPSDPGITLVELLAWLVEMNLYRLNQVTDETLIAFLELLNGPDWTPPDLGAEGLGRSAILEEAIHHTSLSLRERTRAVTPADYEALALAQRVEIRRARCFPNQNLAGEELGIPAPGHVSLVVIPPLPGEDPQSTGGLRQELWMFLEERRLLGVRQHVVPASYVPIGISADLHLRPDARPEEALLRAEQSLKAYYDPLQGSEARDGWPFGRAVYVSEVYALLSRLALVDHVVRVDLTPPEQGTARRLVEGDQLVGVRLQSHELAGRLDLTGLTALDSHGNAYHLEDRVLTKGSLRRNADER